MTPDKEQVVEPLSAPHTSDEWRAFFRERGWVITMDDRPGQAFDAFVHIADAARTASVAGLDGHAYWLAAARRVREGTARHPGVTAGSRQAFGRATRAALEANPQETERPGRDDIPTIDPVDNGRNDR